MILGAGPVLKPHLVDDLYISNISECDAGLQYRISFRDRTFHVTQQSFLSFSCNLVRHLSSSTLFNLSTHSISEPKSSIFQRFCFQHTDYDVDKSPRIAVIALVTIISIKPDLINPHRRRNQPIHTNTTGKTVRPSTNKGRPKCGGQRPRKALCLPVCFDRFLGGRRYIGE